MNVNFKYNSFIYNNYSRITLNKCKRKYIFTQKFTFLPFLVNIKI